MGEQAIYTRAKDLERANEGGTTDVIKDAVTTPLAEEILAATARVKTLKIQRQIKT